MKFLLKVTALLFFAACSGPTGPEGIDVPDGPLQMALVSGGGQEVTVTDTLPTDIVVRVEKGGVALPDQLVDWTVLHDNCGSAFVSTTRTDAEGQTGNRLVAGTRAWTRPDGPDVCQMEVRYALTVADTVQARVDTTIDYLVLPSEPVFGNDRDCCAGASGGSWTGGSPNTVSVDAAGHVHDQYGNPVPWGLDIFAYAHAETTDDSFGGMRTVVADSVGCAPFYIRADGGSGAKADSGVVHVSQSSGGGHYIDMTVGHSSWRESHADYDECVAPYY